MMAVVCDFNDYECRIETAAFFLFGNHDFDFDFDFLWIQAGVLLSFALFQQDMLELLQEL